MNFIEVDNKRINELSKIAVNLNKNYTVKSMIEYFDEMFKLKNYHCFAIEDNNEIIAIASGWVTVRLYCGKQLEIDNVVVSPIFQSKGIGSFFFEKIDEWAKQRSFNTIELNTYIENDRSHKFYFNKGYKILGFHFQKKL